MSDSEGRIDVRIVTFILQQKDCVKPKLREKNSNSGGTSVIFHSRSTVDRANVY